MPTVAQELALVAARVRILAEDLPETARPPVAERWAALLDELDGMRSDGGKVIAILQWRQDFETEMGVGR